MKSPTFIVWLLLWFTHIVYHQIFQDSVTRRMSLWIQWIRIGLDVASVLSIAFVLEKSGGGFWGVAFDLAITATHLGARSEVKDEMESLILFKFCKKIAVRHCLVPLKYTLNQQSSFLFLNVSTNWREPIYYPGSATYSTSASQAL